MRQAKRVLKPQVINVFDNAVVQVKCIPSEDEIDVAALLGHSLARFEFIIGTSFDLQFLSMDGSQLLGIRRYIVNEVTDRIAVNDVNHYQTLSKTVFDRKCEPIGDWIFFHGEGDQLQNSLVGEKPNKTKEYDKMSVADLQSTMKGLRGSGFTVGTKHGEMVKAIHKQLSIRKHLPVVQE